MKTAAAFIPLLLMFGTAGAQDSVSQIGTAQENACNEGGRLFRDGISLCETDWHWECGWYIANWQNTGALVPDWCGTYDVSVSLELGCLAVISSVYIKFGAPPIMPPGTTVYQDANCTATGGQTFTSWHVHAASLSDAFNICTDTPGAPNWAISTLTPNLYQCNTFYSI